VERLVKMHSDEGKRYAQIGRAEQSLKAKPDAEPDKPEGDRDEDLELLDETERKAIEKLIESKTAGLQKKLDAYEADQQQKAVEDATREADRWFVALGDAGKAVFGTGTAEDLEDGSEFLQARETLLTEAAAIAAGYQRVHSQALPLADAMARALNMLHPDVRVQLQNDSKPKKPDRVGKLAVTRPNSPRRAPSDPLARAVAAMRETKAAQQGFFTG